MQIVCSNCPRKCNAIRTAGDNIGGFCRMPLDPVISRAALHNWEEPCISGTAGSGTIFFSGCSLKCVYCQNFEISHGNKGKRVSIERLAEIMKELEESGAHNINLVNPTHFIYSIKEALKIYRPKIPLVYNSGGYDLKEIINENIFDIYLMDFKYVSNEKSLKYSSAANYFEYASKAIKAAYKLKGNAVFDCNGIMQQGLIVRHLLLPQSTKEAIALVDWFTGNTPSAYLSLMAQYTPHGNISDFKEINRKITHREYDKVTDYILEKGLNNVFLQEFSSQSEKYIPEFDYFGV